MAANGPSQQRPPRMASGMRCHEPSGGILNSARFPRKDAQLWATVQTRLQALRDVQNVSARLKLFIAP